MRTEKWDRETFRTVLATIRDRTNLTEAGLAELAGRSRSQVNRWTRAENQPDYEPVRRLVDGLERYGTEARKLGVQLLEAAGYAPPQPAGRISQVTFETPPLAGVRVEQHDNGYQVTYNPNLTMDDVREALGALTDVERLLIYNLEISGFKPGEIQGAVQIHRARVGTRRISDTA